jgi:hypothetical protein
LSRRTATRMTMVITGVAALRIWMNDTERYRYARFPKPSVAACVPTRVSAADVGHPWRLGAQAGRRGQRACHEEAERKDAVEVELSGHALGFQLVRLQHVDEHCRRQRREAQAEAGGGAGKRASGAWASRRALGPPQPQDRTSTAPAGSESQGWTRCTCSAR